MNTSATNRHELLNTVNRFALSTPLEKHVSGVATPSPSFTIVHISDPHLSRQYYREHLKSFKLLLRSILDEGCDHLVITGDIVSTADPDDFFLAREILARFNLLSGSKLTVVPGNHDVFGGPHRAVDILSFPQHIRSVDYHRHLELFSEAFAETFDNTEQLISGRRFPFLKRVGPFSIIGLNSVPPWSFRANILGTNGMLDEVQFNGLRLLAESNLLDSTIPLVAVHHHFNDLALDGSNNNSLWQKIESRTMRMRQRKKILRHLKPINVQCILHGHIHRNEIYERTGIRLANGAGAVCDDPIRFLKYNRLTFNDGELKISTHTLRIPFQTSTVALSLRRSPNGLPSRSLAPLPIS